MPMQEYTVGLISDTHGLLRPEAFKNLKGCDTIIHAGDICDDKIITKLSTIAPVHAVRGNMDSNKNYPAYKLLEINKLSFFVLHDLDKLDLDPLATGADVVVFGHTHRPDIFQRNNVLYINPGSAGPLRPGRPISLAKLHIKNNDLIPEFIEMS